jgi:hypothetical protein
MQSPFEHYLDQLEKPLQSLTEREIAAWRAEAAAHLETLYEAERERGHSEEEACQRARARFGVPEVLGAAMEQEARLVWTKRVRQEVARRILGAVALPLLASLVLARLTFSNNGFPSFQQITGTIPFTDWPLALMFLAGLAGAGYQAVTNRRALRTALAGTLGALVIGPVALLLMALLNLALSAMEKTLASWNGVGTAYGTHLIMLLPSAGFLFAAWCAALGTKPGRAALGGGLFALLTYTLFQLRDCFQSPELWGQWGPMLAMATLIFVLPATLLGGLYALIGQLAGRVMQWLWTRSRKADRQYRQTP